MTKTAGIIGYPLGHSVSPAFQQAALDFCGIDARYVAWETPPETLERRMQSLRDPDVFGASVTVPHKQAVQPYLDSLSEVAREVGAVNTIVGRDGALEGHNTDVTGFMQALRHDGRLDPAGKRVLILGAGGAARAVAYGLATAGASRILVANRTVERAQALVSALGNVASLEAIALGREALERQGGWDLVVNCTTLGMRHGAGEGESPLPEDLIPPTALVYDLVYNPEETPLLRAAARAGAHMLGGLPMLVYQGAEAFRMWTGRDAPLEVMLQAARKALAV